MSWHLKDRRLESQLLKIIPELSGLIEDALEHQPCEDYIGIQFNRIVDGRILEDCRLWFYKWELDEIKRFDPYDWNEYPAVSPPENMIFRVEIETNEYITRLIGRTESGSSILYVYDQFNGWINAESYKENSQKSIRFRPWED